jgi:IPT/TIG domain
MQDCHRPALARLLALAACALLAWSCNVNGNGGDGGSGPDEDPTIDGITPSAAAPGERVSIAGDNFGADSADVRVSFGDFQAEVVTVRNRSVNALVPTAPAGTVPVRVTVGDRRSNEAPFTVVRSDPSITALSPDPVRAGEVLFVRGRELGGGSVSVLADSLELTPTAVFDTLLTVSIPLPLEPGSYAIRVSRDGEISNRLTSTVHIFDVTGSYAVAGTVRVNNCPGVPDAGSTFTTTASLVDELPTLRLRLPHAGLELEAFLEDKGTFEAGAQDVTNVRGSSTATPAGEVSFTARLEVLRASPDCRTVEDLTGTRTSLLPS